MDISALAKNLTELAWAHGVEAVITPRHARKTPSSVLLPVQLSPGASVRQVSQLLPDLQAAFNRATRNDTLTLRYDQRMSTLVVPRRSHDTLRLDAKHWQTIAPHRCLVGQAHSLYGIRNVGIDLTLPHNAHLLVGGTTGSGKSTLLRSALITLLYGTSPSELQVYLVDLKHSGLLPFAEMPHVAAYANMPEQASQVFAHVFSRLEQRRNKQEDRSPRLLLVIDEYAEMMEYDDGSVNRYARSIGRMGLELGIHIWIATQKPTVDVIDPQLRDQLNVRLIGKVESPQLAQYLTGRSDTQAHLLAVGRGEFVCVRPALEPKVVNAFYVDDQTLQQANAAIAHRWQGQQVEPVKLQADPPAPPQIVVDARKVAPVLPEYWDMERNQMRNGGWSRCAEALGVRYAGSSVERVRGAVKEALRSINAEVGEHADE